MVFRILSTFNLHDTCCLFMGSVVDSKDLSPKVILFNLDVLLSVRIYCHKVLGSVYIVELHTLILMYKM